MKTNVTVTLDFTDISDLMSTALYGCDFLSVVNDEKFYEDYRAAGLNGDDCFEDKIAKILLNGGEVRFIDMYAEGEVYTEKGKRVDPDDDESDVEYALSLEDLTKACSTEEGYEYARTLFVDEDGDYDTANCLLQMALFGEVIYG